ncbi:hypothetical protein DH2020_035035 [Rehmannia glutinosa]|uniref:Uncharacterized protein n=1 Tax=Rehmannia glutinosa TaxID=99300 RepID=A0ABR0VA77_REHGL
MAKVDESTSPKEWSREIPRPRAPNPRCGLLKQPITNIDEPILLPTLGCRSSKAKPNGRSNPVWRSAHGDHYSQVSIDGGSTFGSRRLRYNPPPLIKEKKALRKDKQNNIPKTHNPLGDIGVHGEWSLKRLYFPNLVSRRARWRKRA